MSARAALATALDRIERYDEDIGALLEVDAAGAAARAAELDRSESHGALHGMPFVVKANMCIEGRIASCGSRMLEGYRAPYTASAVQRLIDEGAVPIGIANMDEFAFGSSGENSSFGSTRNPWDLSRAPGGSSSGSAAAVAARMVPFALGSDTGGSVRQPAALCGVTGYKPTYGVVSRHGLIAFGSSLDAVGVLATSAADVERVLAVISGADERDATSALRAPFEPAPARTDLRGLRVGLPREYFPADLDGRVRQPLEQALDDLRRLGAELVELDLPTTRHAIAAYYVVATAEASSNLARYDGVRYGARIAGDGSLQGMFAATRGAAFGAEALRRILLGTYVLSSGYYDAWYLRALKVRRAILRDFQAAFERVDVLAAPTSPTPAFRLGEKLSDPLAMYLCDVLTVPTSLAGLPAISVPCGCAAEDGVELPVGLQLIGPAFEDARVLSVARCYQAATEHHRRLPPLVAGGVA
ncbi:MAG: Asp-tRNA(Asn)/Glu-tRNA(Gln) amidotransferase subunit GatA [Planctomycetes bacterium]|nr:Asp-tRNA(Asn)/Glu-tRNA(Gln) amidotransferase subunit GatA [Planctomycetota bacterium]